MSFNVELNDDGVRMVAELFNTIPVLVYSRWEGYTGTAVWRCNQYSTYSLAGEPTDARWAGFWDDGAFAVGIVNGVFVNPVGKLWTLYRERFPEKEKQESEAAAKRARADSDFMFESAAMFIGGTTRRKEDGNLEVVLPKERKKFLGVF